MERDFFFNYDSLKTFCKFPLKNFDCGEEQNRAINSCMQTFNFLFFSINNIVISSRIFSVQPLGEFIHTFFRSYLLSDSQRLLKQLDKL